MSAIRRVSIAIVLPVLGATAAAQNTARIPTATTLTASGAVLSAGQTLTLHVLEDASDGMPPASVDILDSGGGATFRHLATLPLDGNAATYTTHTLASGTHNFVAVMHGDSLHAASQSAAVGVTIIATAGDFPRVTPGMTPSPNFQLDTGASQLTIQTEHHAPMTVSVQSMDGTQKTIVFACTNLPAHVTCSFTPGYVALTAGGAASTQMMVDTDDVLYYANQRDPDPARNLIWAAGLLPLAFLTGRRRVPRNLLLGSALFVGATLGLSGCSGKIPASSTPGIYTVTVFAADVQTLAIQQTTFTLTITH